MNATGREVFQFLAYRWDVTAALDIAATLPVRRTATAPLAAALPLIRIDPGHAATADLRRPLLLVTVAELDHTQFLVDGWHRLFRAVREGHEHLPCHVLNAHQELQVRLCGGSKAAALRTPQKDGAPARPERRRRARPPDHGDDDR
ncbi:hypothetical protein G3I40_12280 [Streptomyces sp. SID14478]|uniref:hypothetical protein n=1 Tax=Streptomyces sp. SID14478 TaxID=2706073 RepID=UPI0013DB0E46|nr:hypothetical protein [Streptomyces sp. SID14478]NEB75992.1 hypothetical protein [Streptomyces sp. SID14478]